MMASHILFASDLAKQLVELCDGGHGPLPYQAIRDLLAKIPFCAGGSRSFCEATKDHPFLHRFVSSCSDNDDEKSVLEIVRASIDLCPGAPNVASAGDGDGFSYPLHEACYSPHAPESVVELLISKSKRSVFKHVSVIQVVGGEDSWWSQLGEPAPSSAGCPLHFYIRSGRRSIEIVRRLVGSCPDASSIPAGKSDSRATPLHALVRGTHESDASFLQMIKCVVESNPSAVRIRGAQERLPIHYACQNGKVTVEMVQLLLQVWPCSVHEKDEYGYLPLHHFCCNEDVDEEKSLGILKLLVEAAPDTVRAKDKWGGLPATSSAICHKGLSCFKYLIKMGGGDDQASHLAEAIVQMCGPSDGEVPYDEIRSVLAVVPDYGTGAVREAMKSFPSALYNFLSNWCEEKDMTVEIVETLLDLFPEAVNIPVTTKYDKNSYPLHVACQSPGTPRRVVELLADRSDPTVFSHLCILGRGVLQYEINNEKVAGTPLHYYVAKEWDTCDFEVVKLLVKACPDALTTAPGNASERVTPLHIILHTPHDCGRHLDIVEFLIQSNPSILRIRDGYSRLPIHIGCLSRDITLDVVKLLLEAWPESVLARDSAGNLPLHFLCFNDDWYRGKGSETNIVAILKYLLARAPDSVRERDMGGDLPIHTAAANHCAAFLRVLVDRFPGCERMQDNDSSLPLFRTCQYGKFGGGKGAVKYLLELYPESAKMKFDGKCPLETALCSEDNRRNCIVQGLLDFDPSFASKEMSLDPFPLHVACENASDQSVLKTLFDAHPAAILATDPDGETPLDLARDASYGNDWIKDEAISFLEVQHSYALKASDSDALTVVDKRNRLLLHRALHDKDVSLGAVKLIVKGNPNALRVADRHGLYPAHVAIVRSSLDVTQYILELDGSVLEGLGEDGNTALHYACRGGNCEVVKFLLEQHASMAFVPNKRNELPLHLLCNSSEQVGVEGQCAKYLDALWQLLLAYPGAVSTAASGLDED